MTKPADGQIAKARRISEIAEREKKATKGPWFFESRHDPQRELLVSGAVTDDECESLHAPVLFNGYMIGDLEIQDNWEFVENARADIPFLLSALASERQAVIEDCCRAVCSLCDPEYHKKINRVWAPAKIHRLEMWEHAADGDESNLWPCKAAAIRSMV